jgi:hypothetical protein
MSGRQRVEVGVGDRVGALGGVDLLGDLVDRAQLGRRVVPEAEVVDLAAGRARGRDVDDRAVGAVVDRAARGRAFQAITLRP